MGFSSFNWFYWAEPYESAASGATPIDGCLFARPNLPVLLIPFAHSKLHQPNFS
jgi:hypothetical protein